MNNIYELINKLEEEQTFDRLVNDPNLQFDLQGEPLLFSSVLPERQVIQNHFRESSIELMSTIANDSTRYAPPQKKGNHRVSSAEIELINSDIAADLDQEAYEHLIQLLSRDATQNTVSELIRWFDRLINRPLALLREKQRVDAFALGYVAREGANDFDEVIKFPEFEGHRETISSGSESSPAGWYDPEYSILDKVKAKMRMLRNKGYRVNRIITTPRIEEVMYDNKEIKKYGTNQIQLGEQQLDLPTMSDSATLQAAFQSIGAPVPEVYDTGYSDQDGFHFFLEDKFIMLCTTGRSQEVNLGEEENPLMLSNTLGYHAIGTATGQLDPGVATKVESFDGKDARIEGQGWQTSFPVIQHPEAYVTLTIPEPTS